MPELGFIFVSVLIGFVALLFVGALISSIPDSFAERRRRAAVKHFRRTGQRITATVDSIQFTRTRPHNASGLPFLKGSYPIARLTATWVDPQTGQAHRFAGRVPPTEESRRRYAPGMPIAVTIAPNDPSRYVM